LARLATILEYQPGVVEYYPTLLMKCLVEQELSFWVVLNLASPLVSNLQFPMIR
jgi:hypothetical protein